MPEVEETLAGWHFAGHTLRDGTPLPKAGEILPEIVDPVPCVRGYHASVRAIDALGYAPGAFVARVELRGEIVPHGDSTDKHAASVRVGLTDYIDATDVLLSFARQCALDVIEIWDAPPVVVQFLTTGRKDLRHAARGASAAAGDAGWGASAAVWAAARTAVWAAAWNTTWDAAWVAASAAMDAASAAAWNASAAASAAAREAQNALLERNLKDLLGIA